MPDFTKWPSFPFEGALRLKELEDPVPVEPARKGEDGNDCTACNAPDDAYIWVSDRWRVRTMDRPTGLPMVLILESRSHLDLGDLPNLLAAELGVMTVRLERAIRSLDGVARVHVNRWGDGSAHLHMWFLARPYGQLQLRGTFLSLWDAILPPIPDRQWRENLALVAAWLAEFGGRPLAEPPRIQWQAPSSFSQTVPIDPPATPDVSVAEAEAPAGEADGENDQAAHASEDTGRPASMPEGWDRPAGPAAEGTGQPAGSAGAPGGVDRSAGSAVTGNGPAGPVASAVGGNGPAGSAASAVDGNGPAGSAASAVDGGRYAGEGGRSVDVVPPARGFPQG
ncbi:hypothetical protein [Plantactinospora sp. GCM10030261]|uniref:hypothetical protein n=1 Tax=Plantactinospora sp. GCM10030261 TaxID=3273420 RepID=UPI00360C3C0D